MENRNTSWLPKYNYWFNEKPVRETHFLLIFVLFFKILYILFHFSSSGLVEKAQTTCYKNPNHLENKTGPWGVQSTFPPCCLPSHHMLESLHLSNGETGCRWHEETEAHGRDGNWLKSIHPGEGIESGLYCLDLPFGFSTESAGVRCEGFSHPCIRLALPPCSFISLRIMSSHQMHDNAFYVVSGLSWMDSFPTHPSIWHFYWPALYKAMCQPGPEGLGDERDKSPLPKNLFFEVGAQNCITAGIPSRTK